MPELTATQQDTLYETGFVHLPGVVPLELVDRAKRAINASLGSHGIDPSMGARTYSPELRESDAIVDLINASPVWSLAESAIGRGVVRPVSSGQIALRFPKEGPPAEPRPHLDGMHGKNNGVPKGVIQNFTALVGVYLSDVPTTFAGNFTVWPGTHHIYEQYFREHRPQSLLDGMPKVDLPEPQQVVVRAGDAVLCHYQLGHGTAGNASPNIRYAIYFRLRHRDHESVHWECMTDIWREWEGMGSRAARAGAAV